MPPLLLASLHLRSNSYSGINAPARNLTRLLPGLFIWQEYDSAVKAELFSSRANGSRSCQRRRRDQQQPSAGSGRLRHQVRGAVFAHAESCSDKKFPCLIEIDDGQRIANLLEVITIDGTPSGEIALYHSPNGGTLIVGDALINFEPYGFTFLPRKYCRNQKEMRRSLRKLLSLEVERMLFAHGTPLLSRASARLGQVLDSTLDSPNAPARSTS
jgi:hypothetical protein